MKKNIQQIIIQINLQLEKLIYFANEIKAFSPVSESELNDIEKVKCLDAFLFRFSKIQDLMAEKLFPLFLEYLNDYQRQMPFIEVLLKLEKLNILENITIWQELRTLRNAISHEYSENKQELIMALNTIYQKHFQLIKIFQTIQNYINQKPDLFN